MKVDKVLFCALILMCLILPETLALTVSTDKVDYIAGDSVDVDGIASADDLNVTADIYNSTGDLISTSIIQTSGESPNYFSASIQINGTYAPDTYHLSITSSSEQINTTFNVLPELLSIKASIIGSPSVKLVDTSYLVTGISNYSSNFSEVFSQSLSGALHFGNISNLTGDGKDYSFALVDDKSSGTYDTVYIDRNSTFTGIWKTRHVGEKVGKNINYTIKEIEYSTGNKIILSPSTDSSSYSSGETINLLVWAKNETHLKSGTGLNITVVDNEDSIKSSKTGTTNSDGYFITNVTAPADVGTYYIKINDKPTEMFSVETFRLVGKITDLAGNPTYTLSKNPKLKIIAKVKATNDDTITNATVTALLVYPNGTARSLGTLSFDNNTNDYKKEVDLSNEATTGKYKVTISALYGGDTQEFSTGFETESVKLEILAINPQFMEDAEGPEAMVDSFAPGAKVSLIVMLSDSSSGSIMESGPESMGLVDIDNQSTGEDECKTRVNLASVIDENGATLNLSTLNFSAATGIMNLSSAIEILQAGEDGGPGDEMLSQCMVIFDAPSKNGVYKTTIRIKHPAGEKEAVSTFSVQRLYATANPVDFKGEDFWFYAPNSSIKIKIKVTDLLTRGDVPAENITYAKIIEMYKVWPSYEDVLSNESYSPGASAANGTITFTSPTSEGFFMFKFRFTAYVNGEEQYGTGNGFFMLKKYMIWGEPSGCERGSACISAEGENIDLIVYIADIDKGSMMDLGKSGLTCDDNNNDGLSDCDGFDVDISELWNDQLMKKMEKGTDYLVNKTSIRSSNATLSIEPVNLPTGWYHVDLIITDPITKDTYFGWAWFEIRNFWVDIMPIELNEKGNLTASQGKGSTYGVGKSILFTATAFDPKNKGEFGPEPLNLSSIALESINMIGTNGPPTSLENNTDYRYTISNRKVSMPWGPPESEPVMMKVINLTLIVNKTGQYAANVRITTSDGDSDIGEMWFEVSGFRVVVTHNGGKNDWLVSFSPSQIVEVNITALDFDSNPVNLSANSTKIRSFWNEKVGRPIKPPVNSTNVTCLENFCTLTANLSMILSGNGKYNMEIDIVDADGNKKQESIFFETRNMIVSIPNIKEIWIGESDTTKRELNLRNDRDRCTNDLFLNLDCFNSEYTNACYGQVNITTSSINNVTGAGIYCVGSNGEWRQGLCQDTESAVAFASNSTHLAYNTNCNTSATCILTDSLAAGDTLSFNSNTWSIVSIGNKSEGQNTFAVKNADGICGDIDGPEMASYIIIPPAGHENYTTTYHGYINNLIENLQWGGWFAERYPDFNETRSIYIYHNTTHLWMSNSTNLSAETPHAVNDIIYDPYGGIWKLSTINRNSVTLRGENVLAGSGAYINASLSKSGVIKITSMQEEWLGSWDKEQGTEVGIDLNGDGRTNSTVYFALSDSEIKGVYDTMFYSKDNNFSNAIPVNSNRDNRTFGESDKLTLLSISPDARKAQIYGEKTGDRGDLGELKIGTNVKIPVIVRSPSGDPTTANVSVEIIKAKTGDLGTEYENPNVAETEITGIGEVVVNLTSATNSSTSGRYTFGLSASDGSSDKEILEEWMWPFVTMRSFLADIYVGDAGYISGLREVPLTRYSQNEYGGWIPEQYTINETGNPEIYGVMLHADNSNIPCAPGTVPPAGADSANFTVVAGNPPFDQTYLGIDATNQTVYTNPESDCNFTHGDESGPSHLYDPINLTFNSRQYMLEVLEIITTPGYNRTSLGVSGIDPAIIEPLKTGQFGPENNPSPKWRLMSLDLSGTPYNVILSEDASKQSPMCSVWNMDECSKKAWFDTDGNFTDSTGASIGDNITSDLYLAKIGPGTWEGIAIGNSSNINDLNMPKLPGIDVEAMDSTIPRFAIVNESLVGLDLNLNSETNNTFYIVAYDDRYDGQSNLTTITVDDDLDITQEWWNDFSQDNPAYYDFYGNESGSIGEKRGSLPNSIWSGNIRFADDINNTNINWEIETFNGTDMLVRRWMDWNNPFTTTDNVTLVLRAYNFDQTPISAADVSVERIMRFSYMGAETLSPSQYSISITNSNKTTETGHVIVTISPVGTWQRGEYMAQLIIENGPVSERKTEWFRIGG